ncbi:MAG TPA: hypothetical protein VIL35_13510 [Vicinamibacterales bacterium]
MPERVITIAISESDWKTLRTVQPEPVDWLKRTIQETIDRARNSSSKPLTRSAANS